MVFPHETSWGCSTPHPLKPHLECVVRWPPNDGVAWWPSPGTVLGKRLCIYNHIYMISECIMCAHQIYMYVYVYIYIHINDYICVCIHTLCYNRIYIIKSCVSNCVQ
jgi:hypothetical protein